MIVRTFTKEAESATLTASETGTRAHCGRVAAWCDELARSLQLPGEEGAALQEAALMHHHASLLMGTSLSRLMIDLGMQPVGEGDGVPSAATRLAERILLAQQNCRLTDERPRDLARLLEAADRFDEQLEYAPFEGGGTEKAGIPEEPEQQVGDDMVAFVMQSLRRARREDLTGILSKLPVYPAIAMRLCRLMNNSEVSLASLESTAKADQVVAGKLLKAANSVFYSPWQPIKSVAQAISYVGTDDARRILLASSIQPLFATPRLRRLWKHALEAAQVAERVADLTGKVDPAEAFLLGLLHDVGKLAISLLSRDITAAIDRLLAKGCQPATAELVLCGFDHAEASAEVLRYWKFAESQIVAVQHHHQPERTDSQLAAVLYLTEFWTDSEEDIPSNARLYKAIRMTGLSTEVLDAARMSFNSAITDL